MKEIFKQVKNYPAYRISNLGRLQSRWRRGSFYNGFKCVDRWKDLNGKPDEKGYLQVILCNTSGRKTIRIHKIVAEAFLGLRPKDKPCVRHLDNNKLNNSVSNLTYGTYKENEDDKIRHGTWNLRNGGAKLTPLQVNEIRVKLANGAKQNTLATEYDVSRPTITRIANNTIWKTV
jgi:hypothetical protein